MNWYLSHEGQTVGPFDEEQAKQEAKKYPQGLAWKEGFAGWAWGSKFADLNNDGWEDLYVANGYISQLDKDDL